MSWSTDETTETTKTKARLGYRDKVQACEQKGDEHFSRERGGKQ